VKESTAVGIEFVNIPIGVERWESGDFEINVVGIQ